MSTVFSNRGGVGYSRDKSAAGDAYAFGQPILPDDSTSLVHLIWRNGVHFDIYGNSWQPVGAGPTYVPPSDILPAGGRLFSPTSYLQLPAGHVLEGRGNFSGVIIAAPTAGDLGTTSMFLSNMNGEPNNGWELVANEGGQVRWYCSGSAFDSAMTAGVPNVIAFASMRDIAQNALKVNGRAIVTSNGGQFVMTNNGPLKIGTHFDGVLSFSGTIYEILLSAWSDPGYSWAAVDARLTILTRLALARIGRIAPA